MSTGSLLYSFYTLQGVPIKWKLGFIELNNVHWQSAILLLQGVPIKWKFGFNELNNVHCQSSILLLQSVPIKLYTTTFNRLLKTIMHLILLNWVFVTYSNILTPISLQPDNVNHWYLKLSLKYLRSTTLGYKYFGNKKIRVCDKGSISTITPCTRLEYFKNVVF